MTSVLATRCPLANLRDDVGIGRGAAAEVRDARMLRVVLAQRLDVDRDDLAPIEQVAHRREEERAPPAVRPGLDDQLGSRLDHDLLVDPEIERVLERLRAEPRGLRPGVRLVEDVVRALDRRPVEPPVHAEARSGQSSLEVVLHGRAILGCAVPAPRGTGRRRPRSWAPRSRLDARRAPRRAGRGRRGSPRPRRTGARPRPRARGALRSRGRRPAARTRAPRAARSSTDRRGWARDRRRARGAAARPRRTRPGRRCERVRAHAARVRRT